MAADKSFLDHIWGKVGAEFREHCQTAVSLMERLDPEDRPKFLAALSWVNWCRGQGDYANGKGKFWDMQ